jgi:hypothetical protein
MALWQTFHHPITLQIVALDDNIDKDALSASKKVLFPSAD